MLLIERTPTLSILARNHCGLGPIFDVVDLAQRETGHSRVAVIVTPDLCRAGASLAGGNRSGRPRRAAISRARPKWLNRSPRLGVISTSRIASAGKMSAIGAPTFASGDKIKRPQASSPRSSSNRATKHAFGLDAAQFAFSDLHAVRQLSRPEGRAELCRRLCNSLRRKRSGVSCRCHRQLRKL